MAQELLTIRDVMRVLDRDRVSVHRMCEKGILHPKRDHRKYRFFDRTEVERVKKEREPR